MNCYDECSILIVQKSVSFEEICQKVLRIPIQKYDQASAH